MIKPYMEICVCEVCGLEYITMTALLEYFNFILKIGPALVGQPVCPYVYHMSKLELY